MFTWAGLHPRTRPVFVRTTESVYLKKKIQTSIHHQHLVVRNMYIRQYVIRESSKLKSSSPNASHRKVLTINKSGQLDFTKLFYSVMEFLKNENFKHEHIRPFSNVNKAGSYPVRRITLHDFFLKKVFKVSIRTHCVNLCYSIN